jgi:hypothetical protein
MADALNRGFDMVLAESLDRFSRDQERYRGPLQGLGAAGRPIVLHSCVFVQYQLMSAMSLELLLDSSSRRHRTAIDQGGLCRIGETESVAMCD